MNNLLEKYRKANIKGKIRILAALFFCLVAIIMTSIYVLGISIRNFPGNDKTLSPFHYALNTKFGKPLSLIMTLAILFAFVVILLSAHKKNYVKKDDNRGVHYMQQSTHGSAEWMDKDRAKEVFTVTNIENTNEVIYGQFTENGEEVVGYKKPKYAEFNRNIFVIAPSGSGKTYTQVKTDFIQHIKAGNSVAVSDPDGGLHADLALFCKERGAEIRVLNCVEPAYSDCWNMVQECINPDTERLDGTRLNMFVNTFMANTGEGTKDFFYQSATNLIKAVIGYTCYWNEKQILAGYERLYLKVSGMKIKGAKDEYFARVESGPVSFKWCRNWILDAAVKNGYDPDEVKKIFDAIKRHADQAAPFTMQKVYDNIIHFDKVAADMEKGERPIEAWHPASINYDIYKSNDTDQVRKSAIQGAQLRFELFIDPNVTYMLSHDGLDLKKFNTRQTVLFVITQDKSDEMTPVASLLFTFLFKNVQDVYDKNKLLANSNGLPNPCLGSAIILDDFFSLGVIGGKPEMFTKTMSDARRRQVYITIIVQQYSQLRALYGEDFKDSIQGNCATLIYLGGNDPETIDFISKFSGEATALDEAHNVHSRIFDFAEAMEAGYRSTTTKRDLLTKGEARTWRDHVLVIQQGEQPLDLHPFAWVELPEYKKGEIKPTSVYKEYVPIYEREDVFANQAKKEKDSQENLDEAISSLSNYEVDPESGEIIENLDGEFEEFTFAEETAEEKTADSEEVLSIADDDSQEESERAVKISNPHKDDPNYISFSKLKGEKHDAE